MENMDKSLYFDLEKAKRDVSKLVQVQRMVTRGGKTFPQTVYILPGQVKATDRVISGQQNLIKKVAKPANGVWDQKYFDYVSSKPELRDEMLDYIENSLGVTWSKNSNTGINVMRAKMALNSYLQKNGKQSITPQNGQNAPSNNSAGKSTQQPAKQNPAPSAAGKIDAAIEQIGLNYNLKQSTRDALKNCQNGREMLDVIKKHEGKDALKRIATDSLGVTWNHNANAGIDSMRMQMEMTKKLDGIADTVSPVGAVARGYSSPNSGVGNKPKTTQAAAPVPEPDKIPVPRNASQRTTNIINIINGITSEADIDAFTQIGMIPEDDVSRDYLIGTSLPKYQRWAAAHSSISRKSTATNSTRNNSNTSFGFGDQMAYDLKFSGLHKELVTKAYSQLYDDFDMSIFTSPAQHIQDTSVSQKTFGTGKHNRPVSSVIGIITDLNSAFSTYASDGELTQGTIGWRGETGTVWTTNLGYVGGDPDKQKEQYDLEKEGFVKYLRKIAEENAGNQGIQKQVDQMVNQYSTIMDKCGNNSFILNMILKANSPKEVDDNPDHFFFDASGSTYRNKGSKTTTPNLKSIATGDNWKSPSPGGAKLISDVLNEQYNLIMACCESNNMSDEAIAHTLTDMWNDDFKRFTLKDEEGKRIDIVDLVHFNNDLVHEVSQDADTPEENESRFDCNRASMEYFYARFLSEHPNLDKKTYFQNKNQDGSDMLGTVRMLEQYGRMTTEDIRDIKAIVNDMFGTQWQRKDDQGNYVKVDIESLSHDEFLDAIDNQWGKREVYSGVSDVNVNRTKNVILSNLLMADLTCKANARVSADSEKNTSSARNSNGDDYSGNWSWYDANTMLKDRSAKYCESNGKRSMQAGSNLWNIASKSADELNSQIDKQINTVPSFTSDYCDSVVTFYEDKANIQQNNMASYDDINAEARKDSFDEIGIVLSDYVDTPLKDVLYQYTTGIAANIPMMSENGVDKMKTLMAKRMDYNPYNYQSGTQLSLSQLQGRGLTTQTVVQLTPLRQKREALLKACHCSIAVEDEATSLQMRKDFMRNWDYNPQHPETTPDGKTVSQKMFDGHGATGYDRRALFNSRFFRINNSNLGDGYDKYKAALDAEVGVEKSDVTKYNQTNTKEMELYHACPRSAVAGILGVTGGWMGAKGSGISAAQQSANGGSGQALGPGAYFGMKGGKSWVYCGSNSYSMQHSYTDPNSDDMNGCYILCTVMRGKTTDSTSDHGRFNDFEIAVHNNQCIKPHHFVDVSARALGINVKRDAQGNYLDQNGQITHDRYGQSIHMK